MEDLAEMVSYSDLPPDTIILCPKCGAKNLRTDVQCRNCELDLGQAKLALLGRLEKGGQAQPVTMDSVKRKANEAWQKGVCLVCGENYVKQFGTRDPGACSFCTGPLCVPCMRSRKYEIRPPYMSHMVRFGLAQYSGLMNSGFDFFTNAPPNSYYVIQPGYYLCDDCWRYLNGPGFIKHAEEFYEKTGRTEELAEIHEAQGFLDEAKRIRMSARSPPPGQLNELIDKLRQGGLAIPYRCPSCGANIKVDKDASSEGLRFCSYCGTAVNVDALVKALESALR